MDTHIDVSHTPLDKIRVKDTARHETHTTAGHRALEVAGRPGAQVVEHGHLVPALLEAVRQV
jgi:hypothetical protein